MAAVTEMGYVHARRALMESFDLVPAFSHAQALAALKNSDIDAVLVSIHFDDSRMFDLMRAMRAMGLGQPCICCILIGTALNETALQGTLSAAKSEGCAGFIDYNTLRRKLSGPQADKQFREEVLALLPPPCGMAELSAGTQQN